MPWNSFRLLLLLLLAHQSNLLLKLDIKDINDINENSHDDVSSSTTLLSVTLPMTTPRWRRLPLLREEEERVLDLLLRGFFAFELDWIWLHLFAFA